MYILQVAPTVISYLNAFVDFCVNSGVDSSVDFSINGKPTSPVAAKFEE